MSAYPTADAYERVCAARDKWQARAELADERFAVLAVAARAYLDAEEQPAYSWVNEGQRERHGHANREKERMAHVDAARAAVLALLDAVSPVAADTVDALFSGKADAMIAGEFRAKYPDPREAPASLDAAWIRHARYDFPTQSPEEFVRGWLAAFDMLAIRLTLPGGQS